LGDCVATSKSVDGSGKNGELGGLGLSGLLRSLPLDAHGEEGLLAIGLEGSGGMEKGCRVGSGR
jgi:hypothetical protein